MKHPPPAVARWRVGRAVDRCGLFLEFQPLNLSGSATLRFLAALRLPTFFFFFATFFLADFFFPAMVVPPCLQCLRTVHRRRDIRLGELQRYFSGARRSHGTASVCAVVHPHKG